MSFRFTSNEEFDRAVSTAADDPRTADQVLLEVTGSAECALTHRGYHRQVLASDDLDALLTLLKDGTIGEQAAIANAYLSERAYAVQRASAGDAARVLVRWGCLRPLTGGVPTSFAEACVAAGATGVLLELLACEEFAELGIKLDDVEHYRPDPASKEVRQSLCFVAVKHDDSAALATALALRPDEPDLERPPAHGVESLHFQALRRAVSGTVSQRERAFACARLLAAHGAPCRHGFEPSSIARALSSPWSDRKAAEVLNFYLARGDVRLTDVDPTTGKPLAGAAILNANVHALAALLDAGAATSESDDQALHDAVGRSGRTVDQRSRMHAILSEHAMRRVISRDPAVASSQRVPTL